MAKSKVKLSPYRERFAVALVKEQTKSAAFRKVYKTDGWKPESVWQRASAIAADVKVKSRVEELMQPVIDKAQVTRESHLARLAQLSEESAQSGQYGAAVAAEVNRGKCAGLYTEKVEVTGKLEHLTDEELAQRVKYLSEQTKSLIDITGA